MSQENQLKDRDPERRRLRQTAQTRTRSWPLFAVLLAWFCGSVGGAELGQFAGYFGALAGIDQARAEAFEAPPRVVALAKSRSATQPAAVVGGFIAFVVTVLCFGRGFRLLSPVFGAVSGSATGLAIGFAVGYW